MHYTYLIVSNSEAVLVKITSEHETSDVICLDYLSFGAVQITWLGIFSCFRFNMIFRKQSQLGKEELKSLLNNKLNITSLGFTRQ